jgi:putative transposase
VPRERLVEWKEEKMQWLKVHEEPFSEDEAKEFHERFTSRMEHWLDQGMGSCALREEKASGIVGEALRFFDEGKVMGGVVTGWMSGW